MLWRLPPSVRSLLLSNQRSCNSTKAVDPLKILFCGSDEFSIASLRALHNAKETDPKLIESIDVLHRPGKRTGRGLKIVREVPIKHVATKELSLTTHEIDTFTGWTPPTPFDLIIAVSFGRLVPQRILNSTKYGGLNVHPSLLPDLRGPAPIHHTLLKRRTRTGVTVQTLHPQHFDQGLILAQTPPPGLDVPPGVTVEQLINRLGGVGGEMLVNVLKDGTFTLPIKDAGWYAESGGPVEHAEKITPLHRYIQFATSPAEDILTRHHVLGNLWFTLPNGERVILNETKALGHDHDPARRTGLFVSAESGSILARTADGQLLEIQSTTLAGGKKRMGNAQLRSMVARIEESRMQ